MKIILVIFGLVAFMFFIQYAVTTVSSENKKEHYWNDLQESFEEEPNDKPVASRKPAAAAVKKVVPEEEEKALPVDKPVDKPAPAPAPAPAPQQAFRIRLLDSIDKAFAEIPNARELRDHKPMVFDELSKKEDMAKVKDAEDFDAQVKEHVEKHLAGMAASKKAVKKEAAAEERSNFVVEEQIEKLTELKGTLDETVKAINGVLSNLNPYMGAGGAGNAGWNPSDLLPKPVEKMENEPEGPLDMGVDKRRPVNKNGVIEGFENVRSYAYF